MEYCFNFTPLLCCLKLDRNVAVDFLLFIYPVKPEESECAWSEEWKAMDPKFQCVALSDGHFIPILEFGTYAPVKVTLVTFSWGDKRK